MNNKTPNEQEQTWLYRIVVLPKYFGEAIFKLLGRDDASEASKFILGYMLIAAAIVLIVGIISPDTVKAFFETFFS